MNEFTSLADYLKDVLSQSWDNHQKEYFSELREQALEGENIFNSLSDEQRNSVISVFNDWVRTEETKAWYSEPEGNSLFQGTSVTSLTVPSEFSNPLVLSSIKDLESNLAEQYIQLHDRHENTVRSAILENVDNWMSEGLFFGVSVSAKVISQAFGLSVDSKNIVFSVDGEMVDPHQITSFSQVIRNKYFEEAISRIDCLRELGLTRMEFEQSLVLADISKPKIDKYKGQIILAPVRCNEIAAVLARHLKSRIQEDTQGRISPRSLSVIIYDTDTPYTYHQISGYSSQPGAPTLPGLTVLGASGTVNSLRWLYTYRISLLAQKIMKSSLWSEVEKKFIPFVFFGVLVERDAEILLDLDNLDKLRYRGMISPHIEFMCLVKKISNYNRSGVERDLATEFVGRLE